MLTGSVLILAASLKWSSSNESTTWFSVVHLVIEVSVALGLYLPLSQKSVPRMAAVVLFSTYLAFASILIHKGAQSCGCFGVFRISPSVVFVFDLVVVVAMAYSSSCGSGEFSSVEYIRNLLIAGVFFILTFGLMSTEKAVNHVPGLDGGTILLDPSLQLGEKAQFLELFGNYDRLEKGRWALLAVYSDCESCKRKLELFELGNDDFRRAILVLDHDAAEIRSKLPMHRLKQQLTIVCDAPMEVYVENGRVIRVLK